MFILPVETDNPVRHNTYALYLLISINVVVFAVTLIVANVLADNEATFFKTYGFVPAAPSLETGLNSMFLHASFLHILGNVFFLWMFGDNVEDVVGLLFFLISYFVSGAAAILAFLAFNRTSEIPLVGASGAISGIVGMYMVFFPTARSDLVIYFWYWEIKSIPTTAVGAIAAWFAEQTLLSLLTQSTGLQHYVGTAFLAHIGGFVAGVILGVAFVVMGFRARYEAELQRHWLFGYVPSNDKPPL